MALPWKLVIHDLDLVAASSSSQEHTADPQAIDELGLVYPGQHGAEQHQAVNQNLWNFKALPNISQQKQSPYQIVLLLCGHGNSLH